MMIKRLVRMEFRKKKVPRFLDLFRENCEAIRAFDGCLYLELMQDLENPAIYTTLSVWRDDEALEAYRNSKLFQRTWKRTKRLFRRKARAWSMTSYLAI